MTLETRMTVTNAFKFVFEKPEGKRPLGKTRRKLKKTIKIDIREIGILAHVRSTRALLQPRLGNCVNRTSWISCKISHFSSGEVWFDSLPRNGLYRPRSSLIFLRVSRRIPQ
jgi:hypothetical protein